MKNSAGLQYPLSPMQHGMLFQTLASPGSGVDVEQAVITLPENLDVASLESAANALVARHDVLRTSFVWAEREDPIQVVHDAVDATFDVEDLRTLEPNARNEFEESWLREDRRRGFDLARAPLLRFTLFRLADARFRFIWTFHHILLDGGCFTNTVRELFSFYEAFRDGVEVRMQPVRPYREFLEWLARRDVTASESFWRDLLKGFLSPTPFNVASPARPSGEEPAFGRLDARLPEALGAALESFAERHDLTVNTLIQGAWAILLGRYSGERDVVFGATRACRRGTVENSDSITGLFINTVPVRAALPPGAELLPFLRQLRAQSLLVRPHEHTPLVRIRECSDLAAGTPLFESIVVFDRRYFGDVLREQGGEWSHREYEILEQTGYPLTVGVSGGAEPLVRLGYDRRRFDDEVIARMLDHFRTILEGIASGSATRVADLAMLTAPERQRILVDWNAAKRDYPSACVHELFERQAAETPDAVAVVHEGRRLTYCELNALANRTAHHLRALGIGPELPVGACFEASVEAVVALLGVAKSGGAYLPLDPALPQPRLAFMLADAEPKAILTCTRLASLVPETPARVVLLDQLLASDSGDPGNPAPRAAPDSPAYVMYTSGSTGVPKGVVLRHSGWTNHTLWIVEYVGIEASDVVLQFASLSFDVSLSEIPEALVCGARVVIPPPGARRDAAQLVRLIEQEAITILHVPPSLLSVLVQEGIGRCRTLRNVVSGGEALALEAAQAFLSSSTAALHNLYGPTETTIFATGWTVPPGERLSIVLIGRPAANTRLYVLDPDLRPVPVGVSGELYIGGTGVARGYLKRPELTAEKFLPDPFAGQPDSRMYRTGDLVRYLPDGNLCYLGRSDRQVKLRGFRVELGEIEAALERHPGVAGVVAGLRNSPAGDARLVSYVRPRANGSCSGAQLRNFLLARLPSYMVPSHFVFVETFPRMVSGKLDWQAFPEPDWQSSESNASPVPPRNERERIIAHVWKEVLGAGQLGVHDNFLELGGHSLSAVRVMSRMNELFSVELPVSLLFEAPTVATLAEAIANLGSPPDPGKSGIAATGSTSLSYQQQRLWFLDRMEPGTPLYNIAWARRLKGVLNIGALRAALDAFVARHEPLRTTFQESAGGPVQTVSPAQPVSLPLVDLGAVAEPDRTRQSHVLLEQEARRPFDLSKDPMLRALILRLSEKDHILLLTMHHIASDGWSLGVMASELSHLYSAFAKGGIPSLPGLPMRYVDFVDWQRKQLDGRVLERQLDYWKRQLAGVSVLELPADRPRPSRQSHRGAWESVVLPESLARAVRSIGLDSGATPFMTFLAAFQMLLHRYSGQDDIAVGVPFAGRTKPEAQNLVGLFVNTLVFRSDFAAKPGFRQLISSVRNAALDAYSNSELPFEKLVEALRPPRDPSFSPLFQAMFDFHPAAPEKFSIPGIEISDAPVETGTVKFDLALVLHGTADGIACALNYNTDLFDQSTAQRMLLHFRILLEGAAAEPDCPVSRLPMLTAPERRLILSDWNAASRSYPAVCVHELFERQAGQQPDGTAAVYEGEAITYGELNRRANQLAHRLRVLGVKPEVPVALAADRSIGMLTGMLAILKAGGAYVPLDSASPPARLRAMIEDAGPPLVLAQERLLAGFPASSVPLIPLESAGKGFPDKNPVSGVSPGNLAYVMYTSGSTGTPKGVEVAHRSVVALLYSFEPLGADHGKRIGTNVASFSFDTSVEEIFACLCFGGTVHIVAPERSTDPRYFAEYLVRHGVHCSYVVPDVLEGLATELGKLPGPFPLRCLITGLAPKRQRQLQRFRDLFPGLRILNAYGPTEVTYGATAYEFEHAADPDRDVPIGRPFPNYRVYITNPDLQPVPVGVPGELLIGGTGVARGYRGQPELTADKFIPNPFTDEPGARLYKTGDRARYLPDGNIEFLGRIDRQVKIRGFRIEPGEIEAVLTLHPAVERTAVMVRSAPSGDQRLVAYVTLRGHGGATAADLRTFLRERLPDHMVPAAYVFLDTLPLMVSGKVDWNALPEPDWAQSLHADGYLPPRDAVEARLVRIWEAVLGVEPVGIGDNFFDLGGHSILAVRLFSEMEKEFGRRLSLSALFQFPTIDRLADILRDGKPMAAWSALVPIQPLGTRPPLFCVHAHYGNVLFYRELALQLGSNQPFYGLQALGLDGREAPLTTVEAMAERYLREIRAVQPQGPYYLGGFCLGAYVALEMARRLETEGEKVGLLASFATDGAWRTVESLSRGIAWHFSRLSRLTPAEKVRYVALRARFRWTRLTYSLGGLVCRAVRALGRPLPAKLQALLVFESNYQANRRYVPKPFGGRVSYFRADGFILDDPETFWGKVTAGGVDVHHIPGRHEEIFRPPNVAILAAELRTCLENAANRAS